MRHVTSAGVAPSPRSDRPGLAVFDFDGTLTDRHTLWRYTRYVAGPAFWPSLLALVPAAARLATGRGTLMDARAALLVRFLGGLAVEEEAAHARRFARERVPGWVRPAALRRLQWHRERGHRTVLVSNAIESYLVAWGRRAGFDDVIGTRVEAAAGRLTGRVDGDNCVGAEKVRRLAERVGGLAGYHVYAYGDSDGDRELLAAADSAFYRNWY
jgi:HAD superfamily hydrolase (TIGR01490 family)